MKEIDGKGEEVMNELENNKIKLYGFNNLTKTLSFNIYDICYAETEREQKDYIAYIDEQYNSERLTKILIRVAEMIGAQVLNISKQDYEPQGASVNVLIAEERISPENIDKSCNQGKPFFEEIGIDSQSMKKGNTSQDTDTVHAHLDKSHITVHTFPEYHPDNSISTFRVDIDIATCGEISPLNTLNYLIDSFDSDIITIDYRIRGFTRDISGKKFFTDHNITSIQDYIELEKLKIYDAIDVNVYQSNIFHTKMLIKEIRLQNYLFNQDVYEIAPKKRLEITDRLRKEMIEIYSGMNIY
ncbi:adenosylmethionine decarboxylase [Leptotrichia sp. HMT-225]|nr:MULTISPECIES: adenosylmethionine decarboxylase [Leptotrichia]ERL25815.1 S-adenosylmethionine decarboxylase proenzyme [Leptotrichia sp. oral taxon 225 str. F0581]WLD74828.1 adenosylmethionine decarboxylase [Leptotrichia sp. HMT-225]